jgi:galactose mutarotase-like enzyme
MITLQNKKLTAQISPKGAELQTLTHTNGINYLWSGDATYWGKYSPVLFPIVGGLKNDTYIYNNKEYKLPRHGFARDKNFNVEQLSETEVVFTLADDADTRNIYPFKFLLQIKYTLNDNTLACTYKVNNPSSILLPFSVGAHPAFAIPLISNLTYSDYYLAFNKPENLQRFKLEGGLIATLEQHVVTENNKLLLHPSLFYEDAIVLKNLQSNCINLASSKSEHGLNFHFNNFPFFGIWAAKDAPFICLEPWCGIADGVNHNLNLLEKEGINLLAQGQIFERTWSVECF